MYVGNVTFDNSGQPDAYVVKTQCSRIRIVEHDRTGTTLATYRVYSSLGGDPVFKLGGEAFEVGSFWHHLYNIGDRPFYVETVNVAAAVFDVVED